MQVAINISKPLKRGRKISVGGSGSVIDVFKYERLLDFFYICGCLDHQKTECDEVVRIKNEGIKVQREYDPWLRAESNVLLIVKNER